MRLIAALTVAVLVFGACGRESAGPEPLATKSPATTVRPSASPGGSKTTAEPDPVKTAFIEAANRACREYEQRSEELEDPEDLDDYVGFWKEFMEITDEVQRKLRALRVPAKDAAKIDAYLDLNDRQSEVLRAALPKIEEAVENDDIESADAVWNDALDEFNEISVKQDPFTREYGLTDCGNDEPAGTIEA